MREGAAALLSPPRSRPLSETIEIARGVAAEIGITRVAELTGLDRAGLPIFQAIRPASKSLTVAQGKGLSPASAWVSAVMESLEHHAAETVPRPPGEKPTLPATDLLSGRSIAIPWDRVSLDTTHPDAAPGGTTVGLGAGNCREEAIEAGSAELLERHLEWYWRAGSARDRLDCQIARSSVGDDAVGRIIANLHRNRLETRLWNLGQSQGIAVIAATIFARGDGMEALPPAFGCGCHADKMIGAVRAITEAAQARAMLIAGSRDDLEPRHYGRGRDRTFQFLLWSLGLAEGRLHWRDVPHKPGRSLTESIDGLLSTCSRLNAGPVACVDLPSPDPRFSIVKMVAPGFKNSAALDLVTLAPRPDRRKAARTGAILFVGPTLPRPVLPRGFDVRPPARAGDLAGLLIDRPPATVGLIDGEFERAPSVWHKEILDLLAHGVAVFGAASLGALRAAELDRFGMVGVGKIYAAYRDKLITRDDAVMVTHAPEELGFRPLTLSLVDAEAALLVLPLDQRDRRMLQRVARTLSFRERTWDRCVDVVERRSGRARPDLRQLLVAPLPSVKRDDAEQLVAAMTAWLDAPTRSSGDAVPMTIHYRTLLSRIGQARASAPREATLAPWHLEAADR